MFDFCGYLAREPVPVESMRAQLSAWCGACDAVVTAPGAVLAVAGAGTYLAEELGLLVSLVGRPWFTAGADDVNPARRLARLWRERGAGALGVIHGSFAVAVLEPAMQRAWLALDRLGIRTLAFAANSAGLIFAHRADTVAAHPAVGAALSPQALFQYFYFADVPAPDTIFRGVEKLLPGEVLRYTDGRVTRDFYWRIVYRTAPRRDVAAQAERFRQLLRVSVRRARGEDERVAAFLSGGTDSSTVAGVLTEVQGRPARTYSIGFHAEGFDESEYARLAARHFGLEAQVYYLQPDDVLAALPVIARDYDEPFANESAVATYYCARQAVADGYPVLLGGDGGDEIFGGNARYAQQRLFEAYRFVPAPLRRFLIEPLAEWPALGRFTLGRKLRGYVRQAKIPLPERLESYNFVYRQPLTDVFTPDLLRDIDPERPVQLLRAAYFGASSPHYIDRMLHLDLKFTLADNDLRKVSRMVEAAGGEVRYPLLDDELVAFSGELPPDWKVRRLRLRWFFKEALKDFLPAAILAKRKHGFGLPFGLWLRDHPPLRARVAERLAALAQRGWLRADYLARAQREHREGHATYFGKLLWNLLILEEWLDAERSASRRSASVSTVHAGVAR